MRVKGTIFSTGLRQPVRPTPANAKLDAMIFMNVRRVEASAANSLAPDGNSRPSHSRNSGVSATSSRLRQYFGPVSGCGHGGGIVFIYDTQSRIAADARSSAAPARFRQNFSDVAN